MVLNSLIMNNYLYHVSVVELVIENINSRIYYKGSSYASVKTTSIKLLDGLNPFKESDTA